MSINDMALVIYDKREVINTKWSQGYHPGLGNYGPSGLPEIL